MTTSEITSGLTSKVIGRPIEVFDEVTSTNDIALQLASKGAAEGLTVVAESQTNGRGRLGRPWNSTVGKSLLVSILLRPLWKDVSRISLAAAVAMAKTLEELTQAPVGIKWPNDIYIEGKKVAGILCESSQGAIVVGVGINVSQQPSDFPDSLEASAGSLAMVTHGKLERTKILVTFLNSFDAIYATLPNGFTTIIRECEQRSTLLGKAVSVEQGAVTIRGIVSGLAQDGGLQVKDDQGAFQVVHSGDVTFLRI